MTRIIWNLGLSFCLIVWLPAVLYCQNILAPSQNPLAGSRVFGSKGCSQCHSVNGVGGKIGPDLARIQRNRSFNDVAANLWNHLPQMTAEAKKRGIVFPHLDPPEAGDLELRIQVRAHALDGRDEIRKPLEGVVLALHRN